MYVGMHVSVCIFTRLIFNECCLFQLGLSLNWELLKDLKPDVIFTQNQINSDDADFHRQIHWKDINNCRVVYLQSSTVGFILLFAFLKRV